MLQLNKKSILMFNDITEQDIKFIGSKAYNVALLSRSFNVPKGVIIPSDVLKNTDLRNIVSLISTKLKCKKYIVRSSANVEDSKTLSWAGCFSSIMDVSFDELEEAIHKCKDSKNNDRVKTYMKLHNLDKKNINISIIIQEYIECDYNGVGFSINPVNDDNNQLIIEYQKGKSGGIVGGLGHAETLIIDKKNNEYECKILKKNVVQELINNLLKIEKLFNMPVDIEFLIKNDKIYITQVRPLTSIKIIK